MFLRCKVNLYFFFCCIFCCYVLLYGHIRVLSHSLLSLFFFLYCPSQLNLLWILSLLFNKEKSKRQCHSAREGKGGAKALRFWEDTYNTLENDS